MPRSAEQAGGVDPQSEEEDAGRDEACDERGQQADQRWVPADDRLVPPEQSRADAAEDRYQRADGERDAKLGPALIGEAAARELTLATPLAIEINRKMPTVSAASAITTGTVNPSAHHTAG
jgi:hypothetical protein